jgi:hypothetical protein
VAQSRVVARFPLVIAGHPLVVAGHPVVVASHPLVIAGHPLVIAGHPPVVAGHPLVIAGHPRVVAGHPVVVAELSVAIARPPVFVVSATGLGFSVWVFCGLTKWRVVVGAGVCGGYLAGFDWMYGVVLARLQGVDVVGYCLAVCGWMVKLIASFM